MNDAGPSTFAARLGGCSISPNIGITLAGEGRSCHLRYLSPSFLFHPKTQAIMKLKGAGLPPGALND